jgi:hypothetical protein
MPPQQGGTLFEDAIMRWEAIQEMEYLSASRGRTEDPNLARELGRQLETLRRYDQYFCDADWRRYSEPDASGKRSRK